MKKNSFLLLRILTRLKTAFNKKYQLVSSLPKISSHTKFDYKIDILT